MKKVFTILLTATLLSGVAANSSAFAASTPTPTPVTSYSGHTASTKYLMPTTAQSRAVRQQFKVPVESQVVITTSWDYTGGSTKTALYKSDSTWITDTGFHASPYKQTIKRTLKPGTYEIRLGGDYTISSTKTVVVEQTPVRTVLTSVVPRMPSGVDYPFGPNSEWKRDVSAAPLAANSSAVSANIADQVKRYYGAAALNAYQYNSPWYQVPATQEKVDVKFNDCQNKKYTPNQLYKPVSTTDSSVPASAQIGSIAATAPGHFTGVPIPADAVPAKGTDKALIVYSPSTDQLWEFWVTEKRADGWYACWGGRIDQVSQSRGYFLNGMGTSATGLASAAGAISLAEARAGKIDHTISLVVPENQKGVFSWPAQRTDGNVVNPDAPMEGQRLRLDPTYDVDASKLHPFAKMVARAAQQYGIIITDKGGAVSFVTEDGTATKKETGVDPWKQILTKPGATKETPTYEVFKNFPWDRMQVLPKDYARP